jgi:hypothetical protein
VKSIGNECFSDCANLGSITFEPDSELEHIGSGAFLHCYFLEFVYIPNTVKSIGNKHFRDSLQLGEFAPDSRVQSTTYIKYAFPQ